MRLATVFDAESNEPRAVFELPNGRRVELRELFRPDTPTSALGDDLDPHSELHEMPIYFTELAKTVEFLDDVTDAVRQWSRERADRDLPIALVSDPEASRVDRMIFLPPVPTFRNLREFDAFESSARNWRGAADVAWTDAWFGQPVYSFGCATALCGHDAIITAPAGVRELDFGMQLGVIIGRGGSNVRASQAWSHVAGFTIINAFVARDVERRTLPFGLGRAMARDFATAVGPYLVSLNSLRDRIDSDERVHLPMRAMLNGTEVARLDSATMHFTWPQIIEAASRDSEIHPGDLLLSGTATAGSILDQHSTDWLKRGDKIELEVERLGTLRNLIG